MKFLGSLAIYFKVILGMNAELMLLGFISLLLTVSQSRIAKICISEELANKWLPCKKKKESSSTTEHFQTLLDSFIPGNARRLLAEEATASTCSTVLPLSLSKFSTFLGAINAFFLMLFALWLSFGHSDQFPLK